MTTYTENHSNIAGENWGGLYYHVLPSLINKYNLSVGAEIGVAFGGHAEAMLSKTGLKKLYCIDSYENFVNTTDSFTYAGQVYTQENYNDLFEFATKRLAVFNDRVILIRKTSDEGAKEITELLDFVFIDAQHTHGAVLQDCKIWYDKVKVGGIISGHDYGHPSFPGVGEAITEFLLTHNLKLHTEDGYVWWTIKE